MHEKVRLNATLAAVSAYTQQLETKLATIDFTSRTVIILAVHELLVNVVEHAYDGKTGNIDIEVSHDNKLVIVIRDYANRKFDIPENISEPDPLDLPENGMGLFIIYDTFDVVNYEHLDDGNRWLLEKNVGDANE